MYLPVFRKDPVLNVTWHCDSVKDVIWVQLCKYGMCNSIVYDAELTEVCNT